jgi:phage terminase small subunit
MSEALTEKQKAFANYLLTDPEQNQTKAYLHAYPKSSEAAATANAARLITNDKVKRYLDEARAKRCESTKIDAHWLLKRLGDEAEADLADIYHPVTGALKPIHEWPKIWRQGLVAGVKIRKELGGEDDEFAEVTEVKLADRNSIKKMIGDHIGVQAFKQLIEHKHEHKHEDLTEEELDARLAKLRRKAGAA